jgi:hypothetical protein
MESKVAAKHMNTVVEKEVYIALRNEASRREITLGELLRTILNWYVVEHLPFPKKES